MSSIPNTKTALVVGDSGAGKSFLINLLVGKNACYSANSRQSVTKDCQLASVLGDNGVEFEFIDTPGINDTGMENSAVQERLLEFGHFAPNGLDAIIVVLPRGRFNKTVHDDLVVIEEFFGDRIWQHSIVVYNQTEARPETIWGDTQSKSPWIFKWKSAGTCICTVPRVTMAECEQSCFAKCKSALTSLWGVGDVSKEVAKQPLTAQAVRNLKQAILSRQGVYSHEMFTKADEEKVALTEEAMSELTTDKWKREMEKVNGELMERRMSRQEWLTRKEQIKKADAARRSSWNLKVIVGTVVGAAGGALVGGPLGALAGAAACGAGTGAIAEK